MFNWLLQLVAATARDTFLGWWQAKQQRKDIADAEVLRHENKRLEKTFDSAGKAKRNRERLDSDPDYARRVRERFTRKDGDD